MEEYFFSGYCRALDHSRMVAVEEGEVDCDFGRCPYEPSCPIAEQIRQINE